MVDQSLQMQRSAIYSLNLDLVADTERLQLDKQETNLPNLNDTHDPKDKLPA